MRRLQMMKDAKGAQPEFEFRVVPGSGAALRLARIPGHRPPIQSGNDLIGGERLQVPANDRSVSYVKPVKFRCQFVVEALPNSDTRGLMRGVVEPAAPVIGGMHGESTLL